MEMEQTFLTAALEEVLEKCHDSLASLTPVSADNATTTKTSIFLSPSLETSLKGGGAPLVPKAVRYKDEWNGIIRSQIQTRPRQ